MCRGLKSGEGGRHFLLAPLESQSRIRCLLIPDCSEDAAGTERQTRVADLEEGGR